jgi:hypothetical protein
MFSVVRQMCTREISVYRVKTLGVNVIVMFVSAYFKVLMESMMCWQMCVSRAVKRSRNV